MRQLASSEFKGQSNPTISCRDNIEYLPIDWLGGLPLVVVVVMVCCAGAQVKKLKKENPRGGHGSEKTVIG